MCSKPYQLKTSASPSEWGRDLFSDVPQECIARPSADEHDGVDRYAGKVHLHCCAGSKRVSSDFVWFEAETSASNHCTCCSESCEYLFRCDFVQSAMAPNRADWGIHCCAWIGPNSIDETCPLQNGTKSWVICSSVNHCVKLTVILLHLKGDCDTVG